jgi:hypothetical protein
MKVLAASLALFLLALPVSAEQWAHVGTFPRYLLYLDLDSLNWRDDDEVEVLQRTVLTEAGKIYFREGYKQSRRTEAPPAEIVARERYFRDRRHKTLSVTFFDIRGKVTFQASDVPYPQEVTPGSPYEAVWEHLFLVERPRHRAAGGANFESSGLPSCPAA